MSQWSSVRLKNLQCIEKLPHHQYLTAMLIGGCLRRKYWRDWSFWANLLKF